MAILSTSRKAHDLSSFFDELAQFGRVESLALAKVLETLTLILVDSARTRDDGDRDRDFVSTAKNELSCEASAKAGRDDVVHTDRAKIVNGIEYSAHVFILELLHDGEH
ncbi:hypothetical protein KCV00_g364, partial [Aureobasidium melanogenum]